MDFVTIISALVLGILVLISTLWYLSKLTSEKNRKLFAERNVDYVEFPNLFLTTWRKERMEVQKDNIIVKTGKKVFGFVQLYANTIMIAEPELIQLVMSKEFTNFTNRRNFEFVDKIFSNVVSGVRDEQWKRLRSIITPAFSTGKLRRMKPNIDSTIQTMVKNINLSINKSEIVEIKQLFSAFTMDTIIQISFGIKVDSLVEDKNPLIKKAQKLFSTDINLKAMIEFSILFTFPKLAALLNLGINKDVTDYFAKIVVEIVKKKRADLETNKQQKASNFIELMLEAESEEQAVDAETNGHSNGISNGHSNGTESNELTKKTPKYITNDEIVAQCVLFFLAGFETTASAITLASYQLAINPEKQKKLYEEIVNVLEKLAEENNNDHNPYQLVTFETLPRFEYLSAVINETLRMHSPAPITERTASNDITLQTNDGKTKIHVKKDDLIQIPIYSLHKDPEHFPEPETFMPERFIEEPYNSFHKYAYLPFGTGPRNCVARSFALMEAKMALLHTILRYKLCVSPVTKVPCDFFYNNNFITPKSINLKLEKRTNIFDH